VAISCVSLALLLPASAQFWNPFGLLRPRAAVPQQQTSPFGGFFGPGTDQQKQAPVDYSRAPSPQRKPEGPPQVPVVVMGDAMADWLAYGLEDAFQDKPDVGILRKHRAGSGLVRYDSRREIEYAQVVRETIAAEKPKFIVMMLGTNDHQQIRERTAAPPPPRQNQRNAPPPPAEPAVPPPNPESQAQASADQQNAELQDAPEPAPLLAPEPPRNGNAGPLEFHTDKWEAAYVKRIDATIVALKSGGVPVLWVGLPPQRGPRATSDAAYLNELYRSRSERAGIVYVDVWDGFVDEAGRFVAQGPDFEGQIRRLRSGDGVYFTKAGARKLAHYVEREIERANVNRILPVALPSEPVLPAPGSRPGGPAARPLAGPVVPLTATTGQAEELLGAGRPARPVNSDPAAIRVLVKGEPIVAPVGRADDFNWPRGGQPAPSAPAMVETAPPTVAALPPEENTPPAPQRTPAPQPSARQLPAAATPPTAPSVGAARAPSASTAGVTSAPRPPTTTSAPRSLFNLLPSADPKPPTTTTRPKAAPATPAAPADGAPRPPRAIGPAAASVPQGTVR
jgi:lysophospholipase L1-like esterase